MLAEFLSLQVSSIFMMMYASVCGAGRTFCVCLFIQHGSGKKTNRTLEISSLSSSCATRMHANGVPACAFVYWYFPVCMPSIRAQCSSSMYGNSWSKGLSYCAALCPTSSLFNSQIGAHIHYTKTHTHIGHQTCIRHTVGVA